MNFLGIGPAELAVIFIIMLVVAGPKRMIAWAYMAGKYAAQIRAMFQETMAAFQKEIAESGVDFSDLNKEIGDLSKLTKTRFDVINEASKLVNPARPAVPPEPHSEPTPDSKSEDQQETKYDAWLPK